MPPKTTSVVKKTFVIGYLFNLREFRERLGNHKQDRSTPGIAVDQNSLLLRIAHLLPHLLPLNKYQFLWPFAGAGLHCVIGSKQANEPSSDEGQQKSRCQFVEIVMEGHAP
jgi:hypothetical protein